MRDAAILSRRAAAALPLAALFGPAAAAMPTVAPTLPDPVIEQIEHHCALRLAISKTSGLDNDPAYVTACDAEEAALQALGDALPTTVTGAAALLAYMADVEGDFADNQSPLLRTMHTVARSLQQMARAA